VYFLALATDYDGTIAHDGVVDAATLAALERLKASGRRLILVTGRELPDLQAIFPALGICDLVVAENGALLFIPSTREEIAIAPAPPPVFVERLRRRGVDPLSVGRSIVATREPHETAVLEVIHELGLELQIVFNKGAVMVLPSGVNKASGLAAALARLDLSPHNVVGIGDAENDHAFLTACGCAVAVANALPAVKAEADLVTDEPRGAGAVALIDRLLESDLGEVMRSLPRHRVSLGVDASGEEVFLRPGGGSVLVAGVSGGGKSTVVTAVLERLEEKEFRFCVADPEGDYAELEDAVVLGNAEQAPRSDEVLDVLRRAEGGGNVVVNMLGIDLADRPGFFAELFPRLCELRGRTGRPHWIVVDEAHHMFPAIWEPAPQSLPRDLPATVFVTVHPDAPDALASVEMLVAVGREPRDVIERFCRTAGAPPPPVPELAPPQGEVLVWDPRSDRPPRRVAVPPPQRERRRHTRKYAEGELGRDNSFYFRGPDGALNLRARNLSAFLQIGEGVDEETWLHHLAAGDYSRWLRRAVKDEALADEVAAIEATSGLDAAEGRARIRTAVARRYAGSA
jgi:HAD superfamily hydrolase (TIGR01484 family)